MKCNVHKHQVLSFGVKKHFHSDITQTETFTYSAKLLRNYLLTLFMSIDNKISPHFYLRTGED